MEIQWKVSDHISKELWNLCEGIAAASGYTLTIARDGDGERIVMAKWKNPAEIHVADVYCDCRKYVLYTPASLFESNGAIHGRNNCTVRPCVETRCLTHAENPSQVYRLLRGIRAASELACNAEAEPETLRRISVILADAVK